MKDWIYDIFGKNPVNSYTAWGLVLWYGVQGLLTGAVDAELFSPEQAAMIANITGPIGQILTVLGIRRAVKK